FFGEGFERASAVRAILAGLGVVYEGVVVDAVLAGVVAFVDVAVFSAAPEKPLHGADVFQIGGAHEFVGGNTEFIPEGAPGLGHVGDEFPFGDAGFFGGAFDVDAVLVGAGGHHDVVAAHAFVAANRITHHGGVGVADVRQAVRVVDRRGEIEFFFALGHWCL